MECVPSPAAWIPESINSAQNFFSTLAPNISICSTIIFLVALEMLSCPAPSAGSDNPPKSSTKKVSNTVSKGLVITGPITLTWD